MAKKKATTKKAKKKPARKTPAKKKAPPAKKQGSCLVIMPFKEPFDTYYATIIAPAVKSASLDPIRADSLYRSTPIMNDLWQMVQKAKVLVAELTERNANVFYELGLAHAIGKPIVLVSETMDDVPFDLRPLRVLTYDKDDPSWGDKLRTKIVASLGETIEDPVEAVPSMFRKPVKSQAPAESETSIRLDQLEREVAALSKGGQGADFPRPLELPEEALVARLNNLVRGGAVPISSVKSAVANALVAGVPSATVGELLLRYVPFPKAHVARLVNEVFRAPERWSD